MENFIYNKHLNIHVMRDYLDLPYSDGQGTEEKLLEIIKSVTDKSTYSEELSSNVKNWVEEYHFSKKRHLIIKHFDIKKGDRVLELGSGCGSITRYLAEIGAEVTSVEGTVARAVVNGERCKDYPNVKVYVDNILNFQIDQKFDWVLLVGVLEYSTKFLESKYPEVEYLVKAKDFLTEQGSLIVAIENKLGIKYLNGAEEDHNGKNYYGIENLYEAGDVTTWGYDELKNILMRSGFDNIYFYGAFPDYKLPQVIFSELIDESSLFRSEELLHYIKSLDYSGMTRRNFEESFLAKSLRLNKCLFKFSNSFIVQCKKSTPVDGNLFLAKYYSTSRLFNYCVETTFNDLSKSLISVQKKLMVENYNNSSIGLEIKINDKQSFLIYQKIVESSSYNDGVHLGYLFSVEQKKHNVKGVENILDGWAKYFTDNFKFYDSFGVIIDIDDLPNYEICDIYTDGLSIDCGLHNLIIKDDIIYSFDLEWVSDDFVPFVWVICRNIAIAMRYDYGVFDKMNYKDVCDYFFSGFGLLLAESDINFSNIIENNFGMKLSRKERSDSLRIV